MGESMASIRWNRLAAPRSASCAWSMATRWLGVFTLGGTLWLLSAAMPVYAEPAGAKALKEFREKNSLYADERWQQYVRAIGARILEHTPDRGETYHFYVLDAAGVNAMAMPGNYIFVSRGLLAFMQSEDQLAAVVGHEIGHIVAKHITKRRLSDLFGKSLGLISAIATGRNELMGVSNDVTAFITSGYGRENELEADRLGGEYIAKAGYNPMAVLDALQVLKDQESFSRGVVGRPMAYHGVFSSHPKQDKRLHDAVAYSQRFLPDEIAEPIDDFWELMDGLVYGDEAAQGLVRGSTYYHSALRVVVEFPDQWKVGYSSSRVNGVAPGGAAVGSINVMRHQPAKRTPPAKYITDVLKRDDVTSGEELEINGMPAYLGELDTSGSNIKLGLIALLYGRGDVFLFKGECGPKGDPETFRAEFRATVEALRSMTQEDLKIANSQRIEIIIAEPGKTYADLVQDTSLRDYPEQTLRLLNGGHPNGEPRAGDYIKVVR